MMRGLTIPHGGGTTNGKNEIYPHSRRAGIADVRPSGLAGDSATARLWIFRFRLVVVLACACLGEAKPSRLV